MSDVILRTAYVSLFVQIVAGLIGLYGISLSIAPQYYVLKELLIMETVVQAIEMVYYVWLTFNFTSLKYDVTFTRYFDWVLSTPIMLISTALYMNYRHQPDDSLWEGFRRNSTSLTGILSWNFLMLLFGFLGERGVCSRTTAFLGGSIALLASFAWLYVSFVGGDWVNWLLFAFMFFVWALYGVAFCFDYRTKNAFYNVIDLFSKNFYGVFLFLEVWKLRER